MANIYLIGIEAIQKMNDLNALGIYLHIYSRPYSGTIDPIELQNHFKKSERFITSKLNNLIKRGLLIRLASGRIGTLG